jgi:hypothetical protein
LIIPYDRTIDLPQRLPACGFFVSGNLSSS